MKYVSGKIIFHISKCQNVSNKAFEQSAHLLYADLLSFLKIYIFDVVCTAFRLKLRWANAATLVE